jgi:hypothetical protein
VGRSVWQEDGSVVDNCSWFSSAQSFSRPSPVGLVTIFYCLRLPFSSPPTTRRVTVEVFDSASIRELINYVFSFITSGRTEQRSPSQTVHVIVWLFVTAGTCLVDQLPSKECPSNVDSATSETCLPNRCLAMDVSAVLLWLHISDVQASCHNIYMYNITYETNGANRSAAR